MSYENSKQRGLSLIQIMIVLAALGIIMAIALPHLQTKSQVNAVSAVASEAVAPAASSASTPN